MELVSEQCISARSPKYCFVNHNDARILFSAVLFFFIFFSSPSFSQSAYTDSVYRPEIKSVEFYNSAKKASFPIITLNTDETVLLAFDNLNGGTVNYHYTLEHCDANWNTSNISTTEYLKNFTDDRIADYSYSIATIQKYTHYELKLPNENISPKIAGNYILKVYENSDPLKLVLTRKLYVVNPRINITAKIVPSNDNMTRATNQKINFTLDYGNLRVQNPGNDIRVLVMQNARSETGILNTQPTYIRGTQLIYSDVTLNDFQAGNEFRHFDTRSLKLNSEHVLRIARDTSNTIILLTDADRNKPNYTQAYDLNGSYYVLNQDGTDPRVDADYFHIFFSLTTPRTASSGTLYIVGRFNDYKLNGKSRMAFDASTNKFVTSLYLKQGVYDYAYVWVDKITAKLDITALEGNYFETENDYQVLVYYRPPGARWEQLAGYMQINSLNK
ncbi:MAG: type IX secretion system plug protein [Mucilaginibacter sp.]